MGALVIRTLIIYFSLMIVIRISGKRQVGQLDISEFVSTILLSEIACLPIDDPDIPILYAMIPISFIVCMEVILTYLKNKSSILKKIFESKCCILIDRGKLIESALVKMRISVEELMGELRLKGVSEVSDVYYAIIEHNGNISVILKKEEQPLTPLDEGIKSEENGISHPIIVDGIINQKNLKISGKNENWLNEELSKTHIAIKDVFLMTVNDSGKCDIFKKEKKKSKS
ncbi:MAG: DUF421 domain-containing protein [Eubacteriales bacterium]|nr:DUF421 domain-containing protein [Eubacteriales bacterium]